MSSSQKVTRGVKNCCQLVQDHLLVYGRPQSWVLCAFLWRRHLFNFNIFRDHGSARGIVCRRPHFAPLPQIKILRRLSHENIFPAVKCSHQASFSLQWLMGMNWFNGLLYFMNSSRCTSVLHRSEILNACIYVESMNWLSSTPVLQGKFIMYTCTYELVTMQTSNPWTCCNVHSVLYLTVGG